MSKNIEFAVLEKDVDNIKERIKVLGQKLDAFPNNIVNRFKDDIINPINNEIKDLKKNKHSANEALTILKIKCDEEIKIRQEDKKTFNENIKILFEKIDILEKIKIKIMLVGSIVFAILSNFASFGLDVLKSLI